MKDSTRLILEELLTRYPALSPCRESVEQAFEELLQSYRHGGKVLCCGNGGSASDAEHIVGELLKKFKKHREIPADVRTRLLALGEEGVHLAARLEGSLGAVSLLSMSGILTAFANDVGWDEAYAQQVLGLGRVGDALIVISTSGNSRNCVLAAIVAHAMGLRTIGLTGASGGRFREVCDICICVPAHETYQIQEFHLPIYHALCAMLEEELF